MTKKSGENNQEKFIGNKEESYSKENLIKSKKFEAQKDLLNALLENDKRYTINEVENLIKKYLERMI